VESGEKYVFITNNSSKSVNDYITKVNGLGIKADKDNFFTSAQATVRCLKKRYEKPYAICPKEAISMVEDEEGFEYPQIDENKCVRCYKCLNVCSFKIANE